MKRTLILGFTLALVGLAQPPPAHAGDDGADKTLAPYFFVEGSKGPTDVFPLKSTKAQATVSGVIANVTVTQVYENVGSAPFNARYVFPASTRAAVHGMTMRLGDRTVTARIKITNRGDLLRIGLFGTARVSTGEASARPPVLVIPRSAIIDVGGKPVCFVRHADGDFELHEVVIGEASVGKVEIVSGLREGEEVVVEGAFTLKSMVLKSTLAEDD